MDIQQTGIILLIKSALTNKKFTLPEGFDFEAAAFTAKKHQIPAILYYGAINCGVDTKSELMQGLFMLTCKYLAMSQRQTYRINSILKAFKEHNIDHMLLKGMVLKDIYPKPEMRSMSDADILIRYEGYSEKIRTVMLDIGFTEGEQTDHELKWYSPELYVELHRRLIPSYNKDFFAYFGDGWKLAKIQSKDNPNRYDMTNEDQVIYLFTHLAKHYRNGGIGIKHMTDLWVYKTNVASLDEAYIEAELKKLRLFDFYSNIMDTLDVWFSDAKPTEKTDFITEFIFESGAYGTAKSRTVADGVKKAKVSDISARKSRFVMVRNLIFLPYSNMCIKYPILKKAPILLPLYWVVRWCDTIANKRKNLSKLNTNINEMTVESIESFNDALNFVGLDFNFKE